MSTSPTQKRLTPAEWATIVTLYQRGEANLRELAEQFGVSKQGVSDGLKSRGIQKNSRLQEVSKEVDDAAAVERLKMVQNAISFRDKYSKWTDVLAALAMSKVTGAHQTGSLAAVNADVLTLKNAMAIVAKAREEGWTILSIDELLTEGETLPELNIGEYSEADLQSIRDENERSFLEAQDDDGSIDDILGGDLMDDDDPGDGDD